MALSLRKLEPDQYGVERGCFLRVSAGMSLVKLALVSQQESLGGAEFVCHIPGTVGGALVMNAGFGRRGATYFEMKDILDSFSVIDLNADGVVKTLRKEDVSFQYRTTNLPPHFLILDATFRLFSKSKELVDQEIKANFTYRNAVQDLRFPSAGSTFKNPKGYSLTSGQLLERAQMKGMRVGGAMVSERHANFFLNVDHATAQDVLKLMRMAQKRVFENCGVMLEPEVKYVGEGEGI